MVQNDTLRAPEHNGAFSSPGGKRQYGSTAQNDLATKEGGSNVRLDKEQGSKDQLGTGLGVSRLGGKGRPKPWSLVAPVLISLGGDNHVPTGQCIAAAGGMAN